MTRDAIPAKPLDGRRRRRLRRVLSGLALVIALLAAFAAADGWRDFGRRAEGARRARMEASPEWRDGHFVNPQPLRNSFAGTLSGALHASPYISPQRPLATVAAAVGAAVDTPPATGLRVTWLGHSTVLVEIDGQRVLTDPVWSERASPLGWVGPAPLVRAADRARRPAPDRRGGDLARSLRSPRPRARSSAMKDWNTTFVVPLGVGAHLAYWGVPESRIVELDWWERTQRRRARDRVHARAPRLGAHALRQRRQAVGGLRAPRAAHRVYYSGDTGLFPGDARHRRAPRPVRSDHDRGRAVRPRLARLAPRPRAGRARAPDGARARDAAGALGRTSRSPTTAGPSPSSACWRPAPRPARRWWRPGPARASSRRRRRRSSAGGRTCPGERAPRIPSCRRRWTDSVDPSRGETPQSTVIFIFFSSLLRSTASAVPA